MMIIRGTKVKIGLSLIIFALLFGARNFVYATDIKPNSINLESYKNWINSSEEYKENTLMPSTYSVSVSEEMLEKNSENIFIGNIFQKLGQSLTEVKVGASANDSKYDLRSRITVDVKNQQQTQSCWAFALLSSMELNMKLNVGTYIDFSEKHMDYSTSESFFDGINQNAFNRKVSSGGSSIIGLAYLTNGQGAVLEEQMPFENSMKDISINDINIDPSYYVKGYTMLPSIYKAVNNNETIYTDGVSKVYTYEEVCELRKIIKQHIIEHGAIAAYTAASQYDYYSSSDIISSKAYYCDNAFTNVDHAVTIVGWDDNYSKENFTGKVKPTKDGAYLVLNSYSDQFFDNGYIWISYEDVWIESSLYGITESSEIHYDNLYQNDEFGANIPMTITANGSQLQEGYYASIYTRENIDGELINEISIATSQYAQFEVYLNPNGDDLNIENLTKVATTDTLTPGYNTIAISPTQLQSDKFAVVVKQKAIDEAFYFMIEAPIDNSFYENTSANKGDSRVSYDGVNWVDLADLGSIDYSGLTIDLSKSDVCIKAFSTFRNVSSSEYQISQDNYITKIYDNTKIEDFISKLSIKNTNYEICNVDDENISDMTSFVKTGMKLKVEDTTYILVVRGDLSGDGKISLLDLSKHIAHYTGIKGFILSGAYDKASDINLDGNLSIIDVSQFLVLYNNM